jgi:Domain of unknown function (DUF3474)
MVWYQLFQDGPEYEARRKRSAFTPPNLTLKDVHDAVPKHLFKKNTFKSLYYVLRHLAVTVLFYYLATQIEGFVDRLIDRNNLVLRALVRTVLWFTYWIWQGFAFAGIWCLGNVSDLLNDITLELTFSLSGHEVCFIAHQKHPQPNDRRLVRLAMAPSLHLLLSIMSSALPCTRLC